MRTFSRLRGILRRALLVAVFATSTPWVCATPPPEENLANARTLLSSGAIDTSDLNVVAGLANAWVGPNGFDDDGAEALLLEIAIAASRNDGAAARAGIQKLTPKLAGRIGVILKTDVAKAEQSATALAHPLLHFYYSREATELLEVPRQVRGSGAQSELLLINLLAGARENLNELQAAEDLYNELLEQGCGNEKAVVAACLSLARLKSGTSRFADAQADLSRAFEIVKGDPKYRSELAKCHNAFAVLYQTKGDLNAAREHFQKAAPLFDIPRERASYIRNIGRFEVAAGDMDAAIERFEQSMDLLRRNNFADTAEYAASQLHLAEALMQKGEFDAALESLEFVKRIFENVKGTSSLERIACTALEAEIHQRKGENDKAEAHFREALEAVEKHHGADHEATVGYRMSIAQLELDRGESAGAAKNCTVALTKMRAYLDDLATIQNERLQADIVGKYKDALYILLQSAEFDPSLEDDAYQEILAFKGRPLRRALRARDDAAAADATFRVDKNAPPQVGTSQAQVSERSPAEALTNLTACIDNDTILIDFVLVKDSDASDEQLFAFCVVDQGVSKIALGEFGEIRGAINRWLAAIGREHRPKIETTGAALRDLLWTREVDGASIASLVGEKTTVVIAPDGELYALPFVALPDASGDGHLIDHHAIAICPFPASIGEARDDPADMEYTSLVVGEVDYGVPDPSFPKLISSFRALGIGKELNAASTALAEIYPQSAVRRLVREGADEASFTSAAKNARWIHVATHGTDSLDEDLDERFAIEGLREIPWMNCGLAFAGANAAPSNGVDGLLTGPEVASLRLPPRSTVVLSACESGVGEIFTGDGVFGLQRAFHVAGASAVVSSRWPVDDHATNAMMTEFYEILAKREVGMLEALRRAQIAMRDHFTMTDKKIDRGLDPPQRDAGPSRPTPRIWAAFTLSGDWREH